MSAEKPAIPRSWLLCPPENAAFFALAAAGSADALILSGAPEAEPGRTLAALSGAAARPSVFLRCESPAPEDLLRTAVAGGADGIVLQGARSGAEVQKLDVMLSAEEALAGRKPGETAVVAIAGDQPAGILAIESFAGKSARLMALGWDGQALARHFAVPAALNAATGPLRHARDRLLLGAALAKVAAIGAAEPEMDAAAFRAACEADRADGFAGKIAVSPAQAAIANAVFNG